jgi:hypothetical protein
MDNSLKAVTALVGLLTALVVRFGAVTDQGWLPSFVEEPAQSGGAPPGTRTPNRCLTFQPDFVISDGES